MYFEQIKMLRVFCVHFGNLKTEIGKIRSQYKKQYQMWISFRIAKFNFRQMPRHSLIFENRIPLLSHCAVFLRNYNSTKKQSWSSPPFSLFTTRKEKFFSKTVIIFVIALSVPKICKQFEHWNIYSLLQWIFSHVLKMTTPDVWCKTAMPHDKIMKNNAVACVALV